MPRKKQGNQMTPANPEQVQDPASSYERAKPEDEAGMGRLTNNDATPTDRPDRMGQAVDNKHSPERQVNAQDREGDASSDAKVQPDHSMHEDEPRGWDLAPTSIPDPEQKRHPRTEGKGGVP